MVYLLEDAGADPTLLMKDASTAFDWAVLSGDVPTMEYLADHPRVDIAAMNRHGCAAVQWAADAGNVETCRWLAAKGLDLSHVNKAKHGAVKKAAWKDHRPLLEWLLQAPDGPQLGWQLLLLDNKGRSVVETTKLGGHAETAAWLQGLIDASRPGPPSERS